MPRLNRIELCHNSDRFEVRAFKITRKTWASSQHIVYNYNISEEDNAFVSATELNNIIRVTALNHVFQCRSMIQNLKIILESSLVNEIVFPESHRYLIKLTGWCHAKNGSTWRSYQVTIKTWWAENVLALLKSMTPGNAWAAFFTKNR